MKAMKYLSMLLMMVALSVCMVGCGSDDDDEPSGTTASIIGNWSQTRCRYGDYSQFKANKTGTINYVYSDGSGNRNDNFEYDYIEKERSLTIIGSQLQGVYYVTLTATKLILSDNSAAYEFTKK